MSGTFAIKEKNATENLDKLRSFFNQEWDQEYWLKWHAQNWLICIPFAIAYMIAVYYGVNFMKNRKPYNLRYPLAVWSGLLGAFSIMGTYHLLPEILSKLYNDGFYAAACDNTFKNDKAVVFWGWLFVWSKVFEFGDTAFIVLRKQKLTFLHWFHHAMTVICVFSYFPDNCSINRWTGSMNYLVHSVMYSYYSFKAFRIHIPRFIAITITVSQIAQMFIGFYVAGYIFSKKQTNTPCAMSKNQSIFSLSIYVSYFILFLNFFIHTYFLKKSSRPVSSCDESNKNAKKLNLDENANISKQKVN